MKKIKHPEFTVTGVIILMIGLVYACIGFSSEGGVDYGITGIGLALMNTGILVLQRFRVGTVMLIIIFIVLAGSQILLHTKEYSIWIILRFLLGVFITGSIVWLQLRYHDNKN